MPRYQLPGFARDLAEHLFERDAVGSGRRAGIDLFFQAGDADLEELVQVRRDDGKEAQALQQRHGVVRRLREHAAVEREDAELAERDAAWEREGRQTDAEAARSESRALTAAITKLEQDTALLRLNLNESAVLESFLLASLRIWSRR